MISLLIVAIALMVIPRGPYLFGYLGAYADIARGEMVWYTSGIDPYGHAEWVTERLSPYGVKGVAAGGCVMPLEERERIRGHNDAVAGIVRVRLGIDVSEIFSLGSQETGYAGSDSVGFHESERSTNR